MKQFKNLACRLPIPAAISMALACPVSGAQDMPVGADPNSRSASDNKLYRVEVKGQPQSDVDLRRNAAVAKQIFGREEIDRFGDSNVNEVVRRLPGVDIQNGQPRLRGMGSGYTQILINGEPAPTGFLLDQINPAQVERIEIQKAATADQSTQAVAGSINIVLKTVAKKRQASVKVGAAYSAERPTANVSTLYSERAGDLSYSLPVSAYEYYSSAELKVSRHVAGSLGTVGTAQQSAQQPMWGHSFNATPQFNWRIDDDQSVNLQAFLQRSDWHSKVQFTDIAASNPSLFEDSSNNEGRFENHRLTGQWSSRFSGERKLELKLMMGQALNEFVNQSYRANLPYRHSVGEGKDRTLTQSGKYGQLVGDYHRLSAGWEFEFRRRDDERNVTVLGSQQLPGIDALPLHAKIDRQAYFLQDEWELSDQWLLYGGLRHETITTRSDTLDGAVSNRSQVLSPLLHVNFKPDPKARDVIRGSLTRSYKAPDLYSLIPRPTLNSIYPLPTQQNDQVASDRAGNPLLRPELATGLDLAYEMYFTGGGLFSVGLFHRRVEDLIRYVTTLENVSWATVPRWVSRPQNISTAHSSGIELEFKGPASQLLPGLVDVKTRLDLRGTLNLYRSKVDAVPMPNSRLDGQQPWSATLGFDYKAQHVPLTFGANLSYTPGYATQQTLSQALDQTRSRALDLYALWNLNQQVSLRFGATNAAPQWTGRITSTDDGSSVQVLRKTRPNYTVAIDIKL
ncbi:TonB-dependent receptor plug domain-containing protein [Undibacterium crateris]|uniref:TonB-dependent receptor plug domain-containing protein n=1 Tax=Undibacterium crateris TaxID=2528175 RepID=UPI00138940A5|nr:TonB-dependent receptor [Undibacterium crateris]NDI85829.1 TonB-dependent receptor [Undibacterium crateris]